jgi:hypothetical protein
MPEYVLVSENEHDRRLKEYFHCNKAFPCKECHYYVGCLKTRAYALKGWIFDPLKKCYRDKKGRIVKRLQ